MNEAFRLITNDQGFIDSEEFKELLMEHGMSEKLAEDLIQEGDKNGTFDQGTFIKKLYKKQKVGKKSKKAIK